MTSSKVIIVGPDSDNLMSALQAKGADVTTVSDMATRPDLEEAGIVDADIYILTDLEQATTIPIVKDLNPDIQVVAYDRTSLPEFTTAQTDLAIDPDLLDPSVVADELIA